MGARWLIKGMNATFVHAGKCVDSMAQLIKAAKVCVFFVGVVGWGGAGLARQHTDGFD